VNLGSSTMILDDSAVGYFLVETNCNICVSQNKLRKLFFGVSDRLSKHDNSLSSKLEKLRASFIGAFFYDAKGSESFDSNAQL